MNDPPLPPPPRPPVNDPPPLPPPVSDPPPLDELRRRAERALPPHAPEPLRSALRLARLRLEADVEGWDTSTNHVRAHRVGFGTDAATLASLRRSPSLYELLCEAFSAALAFDGGQSLFDLRPYWGLGAAPPGLGLGPYRGERAPPEAERDDGEALRTAALAYLEVSGDAPARRWLEGASLLVHPDAPRGVRVEARGEGPLDESHPLERALVDLLAGFESRRASVRFGQR
ncbi:MAG: hypothetical protein MUF34_23250 [Polyangiaceae bacterium]|nr:hypothetical protein [Polyangiaceae bacterium]